MDLINKIFELIAELKGYIKELERWGIKRANAEKEYNSVLAQEVLIERDKGTAIGVIDKTCKGKKNGLERLLAGDGVEVLIELVHEERRNRRSDLGDGHHTGIERLVSGNLVLAVFAFPEAAATETHIPVAEVSIHKVLNLTAHLGRLIVSVVFTTMFH